MMKNFCDLSSYKYNVRDHRKQRGMVLLMITLAQKHNAPAHPPKKPTPAPPPATQHPHPNTQTHTRTPIWKRFTEDVFATWI
jgi:hypothetical protein